MADSILKRPPYIEHLFREIGIAFYILVPSENYNIRLRYFWNTKEIITGQD
tara:strand:- start:21 stop:173 length:153 start_codon:yes stop_codon:yes gene_type:complete